MEQYFHISEEVLHAVNNGLPVVALETTLISFGLPYPHNLEAAHEMERIIYDAGAVPATIGLKDGKVKVGLTRAEIEEFASNPNVTKVSRRDIPYVLAKKALGATTISATMIAAEQAGIKVFSTGGLGGFIVKAR